MSGAEAVGATLEKDTKPTDQSTHINVTDKGQIMKGPLLRRLYCLLLELSLDSSVHQYKFGDTFSMDIWNNWFVVKLRFEDMVRLSDMLFNEVRRQFEQLFSDMGFLPVTASSTQSDRHSNLLIPFEDFVLLLRCCMAILQLLEFDQSLVLEKCQILLTILKRLFSLDLMLHVACHKVRSGKSIICFKKSVSHECKYTLDGSVSCVHEELDTSMHFTEQDASPVALLCSILEVFADDLLVHQHLRYLFVGTDRLSCAKEMPFICVGDQDDIVLEVISAHFILSVSDDRGINGFPDTLFWSCDKDFKIPQLSLTAAMAMLSSSAIFTAPQVLQAHLISLVSGCIGIQMAPNNKKLNPLLLNNCMLAFELSVNLYTRHTSSLRMGSWLMEPCILDNASGLTFKSYIQPDTYDKINGRLCKLVDPCHPCFLCLFSRTKSDLLNASKEYIKENHSIIDKSCRDEACSILNCIIGMILHEEKGVKASHHREEINRQEIYLLAAGLKLMSCSLLQVVWFMMCYDAKDSLKTLKDFSVSREYDLITAIISCFGQYNACQPIQRILLDVMGTYPARHKYTKPILLHFVGLLSFSFYAGPDFLWKGCVFVMMSLLNLLIFEEGNLDALLPLLDCKEKSSFSQSSTKISQDLFFRRSSQIVALNFEKIQTHYIRERSSCLTYGTNGVGTCATPLLEAADGQVSQNTLYVEDMEESGCRAEETYTCSGEIFLESLGIPSDSVDNLADFIECRPGKDYSSWMKKRQMYRKWKCGKLGVAYQHERKNRALKYIKYTGSRHRHQ